MLKEALRVIVSGSREWPFEHSDLIHERLDKLPRHAIIVHGMCPTGVDSFAEDWAVSNSREVDRFPADWRRNGLGAGHVRNVQMLEHVRQDGKALVLCFFWTISPGTLGMAKLADKANLPLVCYQYTHDGEKPCLLVIENYELSSLRS